MSQITNYLATALHVKPNDIPFELWNAFLCDFPRCSAEINLPQEPLKRYQKTAAILMIAIMDNLISQQQLDILFTIRDLMKTESSQTQKIVLDYNKFIAQITPWHSKDQFPLFLQKQREYIYSHMHTAEGIDLFYNVYRCVLLSGQFFGADLIRNGRKLTKQETILELTSELREEDSFILKDHHLMAISQIFGIPLHSYYNVCDGKQIYRKRIHQPTNIKSTIGLLYEPVNKTARSVRILYQQHDSIYISNSENIIQNIQRKKDQMLAAHKVQKLLECSMTSTLEHCYQIVQQKDLADLWPENFYVELQTLVESLNFKVVKMDEILTNLDSFAQYHLEQFRAKTDKELKRLQPNIQIQQNRPKIFQSVKFRTEQAIYNYQNRQQQKTILPPTPEDQVLRPPNLGSPMQPLARSFEYHDTNLQVSLLGESQKQL